MATKTKSKTATKKPVPRKVAKAADSPKSAAKPKVEKKAKVESAAKPSLPAPAPAKKTPARPEPDTQEAKPSARRGVETVSLLEEKEPRKKGGEGEVKKKGRVLPPISRIRASMAATAAPPKPAPPAEPVIEPTAVVDGVAAPASPEI